MICILSGVVLVTLTHILLHSLNVFIRLVEMYHSGQQFVSRMVTPHKEGTGSGVVHISKESDASTFYFHALTFQIV